MSTDILELSADYRKFLERVALHLKKKGVAPDTFSEEIAQNAMIEVLRRDQHLTDILLDKTPATQDFRDAFAKLVYDACKESSD